ncbi:MAG: hypothetical protein A2144_07770 [Chloroflexi bacterium RBG_16_50_9]|nr:MAG: hypothetical protein A2144_07770 [Chloroflexi bacterium RBG_16_50_9]
MASMLYLAIGATQSQGTMSVSLDKRIDVPPVQQMSDLNHAREKKLLRVAIAGVISPSMTLEYYQELLQHMGRALGMEVSLVLKPSYAEINDLVRGGRVEVAFVCSLAYCEGYHDFGMELLVAPQVSGDTVYYSYLIVPRDSPATGLEDLRGRSFAFSDPLSNSGYLVPTYQLSLLEEKPASFFGRYTFTYSHDNSIAAVAAKLVDGAAVDSLVYDQLVKKDPGLASNTRVIARWGPYGIPPVVVNPNLDQDLKNQLKEFFLSLHESEEGQAILKGLAIDKFVLLDHDAYASLMEMKEKVGW